ncbi:hypothetical protein COV19_02060 [Candidatus Woesearchaeota archaeon CG10_big_fil_rev_8_21_14_0_10_44_13]|nr:MAG: hypothetical protein COV19_02060 [Candidatus Woesearchaeota archaeon CG10_big_fil_rev_8_21_14_0_10_44_13]
MPGDKPGDKDNPKGMPITEESLNFLSELIAIVGGDMLDSIYVPRDKVNVYELFENPEAIPPHVTEDNLNALAVFAVNNAIIKWRGDENLDGLVDKIVNSMTGVKNERMTREDAVKLAKKVDEMKRSPEKYFSAHFKPEDLEDGLKKAYNDMFREMGSTDGFVHQLPVQLMLKVEVANNLFSYFKRIPKDDVKDIIRKSPGLVKLLEKHDGYVRLKTMQAKEGADGSAYEGGPKQNPQDTINPSSVIIPKQSLKYRSFKNETFWSDWWDLGYIRKAITMEKKTGKKYRKDMLKNKLREDNGKKPKKVMDYRLTTCMKEDYNLTPKDPKKGGLFELLGYNTLKEAVESGRYNREELQYYNGVLETMKKRLFREAFVAWSRQDLIEYAIIGLVGLLIGVGIGHKYPPKPKPCPPCPPQITCPQTAEAPSQPVSPPVQLEPEYTEKGCQDNCSDYFKCEPKVEYRDVIRWRDNPSCEGRKIPNTQTCPGEGRRIAPR